MNRQQLKERLKTLTPEEREKLKEYTDALSEIKKEIKQLLNKGNVKEGGSNHNRSSGLYLQTEE